MALRFIIAILLATSLSAAAAPASVTNPPGVTCELRFKGAQRAFHQGELIELELAFSSSGKPGAYVINAASYDRGGRMEYEEFALEPATGFVDPLHEYFHADLTDGFESGGATSFPEVEAKPYVVPLQLNEWRRFDRAGTYRLYVKSHRLNRKGDEFLAPTLPAVSNAIEFTILPPDAAWARRQLQQVLTRLRAGDATTTPLRDEARAARRRDVSALRFLDTPESVRAILDRIALVNRKEDFEWFIALVASRHRALILENMRILTATPNYAVTSGFAYAYHYLSFMQQNPTPPPHYPLKDKTRLARWQQAMDRRHQEYKKQEERVWAKIEAGLARKRGAARSSTFFTLLTGLPFRKQDRTPAQRQRYQRLAIALPRVFDELAPAQQEELLGSRWESIDGAALAPNLRRLAALPTDSRDPRSPLRATAQRRLNQLHHEATRETIAGEITSRKHRR